MATILAETGFGEYGNKVFRFYEQKKYNEALAAAREASERFPDYGAKTSFWIACLQTRLGDLDGAIRTLQSATKRGNWWLADTLRDSDLDPLRDMPEFKIIEEESKRLGQQAPKVAKPELMVRTPTNYSVARDWPALVVFHARYGERPEISAEEWSPALSAGTILAAPWSSQVYAPDGRCWDNWEVAESDVEWTFEQLRAKYRLNLEKIVLGGFSQGAALSIYSTLKRVVPSRGFVAVASSDWVRPEARRATERKDLSESFASFVKGSDCRGLRGAIIIGDRDPFFKKVQQLYALMVERGLDGKLMVEPGVGHEYPKDFKQKLQTAMNFVLEKS